MKEIENTDYIDLIVKFLAGEASEKETAQLEKWVEQSQDNKEKFSQIQASWIASAQLQKGNDKDIQQALTKVNDKLSSKNNVLSEKFYNRIKYIVKVAAAILLFVSIGSAGSYFYLKNKESGSFINSNSAIHVYAPLGSKAVTILPDGTKVWLNAGSNLMYTPSLYGKEDRQVTLIGEGFFKVKTNAQIPFVVNAKKIKIKALGTEFNVKAYPEEDNVQTILVEGIVKIDDNKNKKEAYSITLQPKQKVTFKTGRAKINSVVLTDPTDVDVETLDDIELEKISLENDLEPSVAEVESTDVYTSWKDERWVIKGEKIGELAVLLERRFNVDIIFYSNELKDYRFSGTFQNETLEQILQILTLTAPLQYEINKGIVNLELDTNLNVKYKKYINK